MITFEDFSSLEPGDLIEAVPLLPGLSDKVVCLMVTSAEASPADCPVPNVRTRLVFDVTYFGISMGRWACRAEPDNTLKWELAA